ncbi:MAG: hypothetical protein DRR16_12630 [Candidatus Parabeggiatoa sp. nov. 3]|nr:MAG: hypothetical protein DRR00_17585 [Gammaproteobacteria bacterium]RKZ65334.1 MAG: hypothetical protein DRQ99_12970 [Gammaproteobacteria bacterium]RKZ85196.1 MAG: hypothetical protein DRR16_12630 [Gammaproteobacteria bacterium]HEW97642.1 hypothetical protein [Beggiatoa sp.]
MSFDIFPLHIFPQGSLSSSIITTVWVGVFVIAYFNLRLGWVLSGLVVPGYVVPLLILNPWSAAIIILESIVTYFIVWLFSEYLSRWGPWCNFFGRDRFLAIVLTSVLVRIIFDAWLLPQIGEFVVNRYHFQFDYRNQLHSFGLIIIALIANQFWKTGLVRGLIPLFTALGLTYVIVRFGLMELTNFSISNLGYVYEDLAVSILSAPKAYIIVIVTAFVASRMNLHYSWDFNGILIPALLALQWYQPYKILTSFLEAFIILVIAHLVLASPLFKSVTMEGARKLLLFFNISFIYKIALSYFLLWYMPTVKITDYYAFGYLLSTLMAIKMYDKQIAIRMTRIILQISLTGVALASVLGFAMTLIPSFWYPTLSTQNQTIAQIKSLPQTELFKLIHQDRIFLYQGRMPNSFVEPVPQEIESFQKGLKTVLMYRQTREQALLQQAANHFAQVNYQTLLVQQRYVYLRETPPRRNWGIYVLDLDTDNTLLVEVPAPLDEWGTMEVGAIMFTQMPGHALAIAGSARGANQNALSDMLLNYHSFFQTFHQMLAQQNAVQIRAYTSKSRRVLSETLQNQRDNASPLSLASSLWVKRALSAGLDLSLLKHWMGHYEIKWTSPSLANAQRTVTYTGFTELFLNQDNLFKILFSQINDSAFSTQIYDQRIDGYLQDWLLAGKGQIAPKGTNLYVPPSREELLFFDQELLTPLLKLIRTEYQNGQWSEAGLIQLRILASEAAKLGYGMMRYRQRDTEHDYLILQEQREPKRYWGTYVFRLEVGTNYMVQVPRPLYEMNSFEYAVALFERLQAKVLLIGGTHPLTNVDSSADLLKYSNRHNIFNLVNQVILREQGNEPLLVIHSRAFGSSDEGLMPPADILLAFDKGIASQQGLTQLGKTLYDSLQADDLTIEFVHGQASTIGYEVGNLPQALYLSATQNKEFVLLWLSPTIRQYYRQQAEYNLQGIQFKALNIPTVSAALYPYLISQTAGKTTQLSKAFRARVKQYIQEQDMLILQSLLTRWPQYRLERFIDVNSRQAFLLIYDKKGKLSLVANLFPRDIDNHYRFSANTDENRTIVTRFIETRMGWLEF